MADETLEDQKVIDTIQKIDRGICNQLPSNIISVDATQYIRAAVTDRDALGFLREASGYFIINFVI